MRMLPMKQYEQEGRQIKIVEALRAEILMLTGIVVDNERESKRLWGR